MLRAFCNLMAYTKVGNILCPCKRLLNFVKFDW